MKVTTARGTIEVGDVGEGRPVVLLHALALSGRLFDPLAADWAARRRVLTPTRAGTAGRTGTAGRSPARTWPTTSPP
ncbi:alpha/beta fold hydrolase [Pseudonocardia benzenivorans]